MHFTPNLPYACLYAFHRLPSLRVPLCISMSTFPAHASMHFTLLALRTPLRISQSTLCVPLCISLSTFPAHLCASLCACPTHAIHCLLSLRMPLCASLCTCPAHASMHCTVYSAHASMQFTVYFPCSCICALRSALAARIPPRVPLSTLCLPLCISLYTFPAHASMHFNVRSPYACLYEFHSVLALRRPGHASVRFTVNFSPCIIELRSVLALCSSLSTSLRVPLRSSLSTLPAHASTYALHSALALCVPYTFHCLLCARHYAFHSVLSLRMPLRSSLCTLPMRASTHCTLYFTYACPVLFTVHLLYACLYAFHCLFCYLAAGAAGTYFACYFCTQKLRLRSRSCGDVLRVLLVYFKVATLQPDQPAKICDCACTHALHPALARMPLCVSRSTFLGHASISVLAAHASMHFTLYFLRMPRRSSLYPLPAHAPCACSLRICAFHSALALRMPLCISLSTLRTPVCISLSTFPAGASMHFTLYLLYACLYAFHCALSLLMPLCVALCALPTQCPMRFTVHPFYACLCAFHYLFCYLAARAARRTLRATFVLNRYDFAAGTCFVYYFCA